MPIPRKHGKWVPRAGVVEYLEEYARRHQLRLRLSTPVDQIERESAAWKLVTPSGPLTVAALVIATGYNHTPHLPDWPGSISFAGELIHSARYRTAAPFRGRDVLVVGTGHSGAEIAVDARRIAKALRAARLTAPPRAASFRHGADPDGT